LAWLAKGNRTTAGKMWKQLIDAGEITKPEGANWFQVVPENESIKVVPTEPEPTPCEVSLIAWFCSRKVVLTGSSHFRTTH
jgi:hypothetical protein